jgi:hypothetical protein
MKLSELAADARTGMSLWDGFAEKAFSCPRAIAGNDSSKKRAIRINPAPAIERGGLGPISRREVQSHGLGQMLCPCDPRFTIADRVA